MGGGNATAEATKVPFLGLDRTNMPVSFAAFASLTTVPFFFFFSIATRPARLSVHTAALMVCLNKRGHESHSLYNLLLNLL